MVCSGGVSTTGNYSKRLQHAVTAYTSKVDWSLRWPKLVGVCLARPTVNEETIIDDDYTVSNANDSGTILFSNIEIGVSPCLFREFNETKKTIVNDLLLKHITNMEVWTWQDFEKAHALYLSAVMAALIQTQPQFFEKVTLGNLLRHAQPTSSAHLNRTMELPNQFNALNLSEQAEQSIPKKTRKRKHHSVDLDELEELLLACDGTPIVDAHLNLRLSMANGGNRRVSVVLFIQYKHSKLGSKTEVKVSEMNAAVAELNSRLQHCKNWKGGEWLFLWVSNRVINDREDHVTPDPRLLWVGKNELVKHAPLIGRRGLVPVPDNIRKDEEDDEEED